MVNFFGSDERRVDYAAAVEGSSSSSSSLVLPEQSSSRPSSVAVTDERTNRSMMRGCSSSSNLTSVLSTQQSTISSSSVSPSFVYTFQNCCTVHHLVHLCRILVAKLMAFEILFPCTVICNKLFK